MNMDDTIELGDEVEDVITGFKGIATAKIEYIYGCVQFQVTPPYNKEKGEHPKKDWIDVQQLVIIKKGAEVAAKKKVEKKAKKLAMPPSGGEREHPGE